MKNQKYVFSVSYSLEQEKLGSVEHLFPSRDVQVTLSRIDTTHWKICNVWQRNSPLEFVGVWFLNTFLQDTYFWCFIFDEGLGIYLYFAAIIADPSVSVWRLCIRDTQLRLEVFETTWLVAKGRKVTLKL